MLQRRSPAQKFTALKKSDAACEYLIKNSYLAKNAVPVKGDICRPEEIIKEAADIIVSNPPYVKTADISNLQSELAYEPKAALDGGADGLFFYNVIANKWKSALKSGGKLCLEIGEDQGNAVSDILADTGFKTLKLKKIFIKTTEWCLPKNNYRHCGAKGCFFI